MYQKRCSGVVRPRLLDVQYRGHVPKEVQWRCETKGTSCAMLRLTQRNLALFQERKRHKTYQGLWLFKSQLRSLKHGAAAPNTGICAADMFAAGIRERN